VAIKRISKGRLLTFRLRQKKGPSALKKKTIKPKIGGSEKGIYEPLRRAAWGHLKDLEDPEGVKTENGEGQCISEAVCISQEGGKKGTREHRGERIKGGGGEAGTFWGDPADPAV